MSDEFGNDFIEERLHVESKTSQSEIVCKSLARFSTQYRVKESVKPLLAK